jgi:hypothetical protein
LSLRRRHLLAAAALPWAHGHLLQSAAAELYR